MDGRAYPQTCHCRARVIAARQDAERLRRQARSALFHKSSPSYVDPNPRETAARLILEARNADERADALAARRGPCHLCLDTGVLRGNGSAQVGGRGAARQPSEQSGSVRIA